MTLIACIDDHASVRRSIANYLKKSISPCNVYEYNNGLEFITKFPKEGYTPDIVLMDIRMSPMNGYETTQWLKDNHPSIPVLAFSDIIEQEAILEISFRGAKGCTEKNFENIERLPKTIEHILKGETYYDTVEIHKLVKTRLRLGRDNIQEGLSSLSNAEMEIVELAPIAKTAAEKASSLNIKESTFNRHVSNVYTKLNIHKSQALIEFAKKMGL
jgi:DNA-binding NarL/FixJ family response regulator